MADSSLSTPTFPPTMLPLPRPRSPAKRPPGSPTRTHTITKEIDPLIANLSAESVLLALQSQDAISTLGINSSTGDVLLRECIEKASAHDKELGIRAALAGKKVKVWLNEVSGWVWPEEKFCPPGEDDVYGANEVSSVSDASVQTSEYWGSLPAEKVIEYEKRISEIRTDMQLLGVEDLKRHVRAAHTGRSLSSLSRDAEASGRASYVKLEDFEMVITSITVQLLPSLAWLGRLMDAWSVRLSVLRLVPDFLFAYDDAAEHFAERPRADEHFDALDKVEAARDALTVWKAGMDGRASTAGRLLDRMLDLLEGSADRISDSWIDDLEGLERDGKNAYVLQMKDLDVVEQQIHERERIALPSEKTPEAALSDANNDRPLTAEKKLQPESTPLVTNTQELPSMTDDLTMMARALDGVHGKMYSKTAPAPKEQALPQNDSGSDLAALGRTLSAAQQGFYPFAVPAEQEGAKTDVFQKCTDEESDGVSDLTNLGRTLSAAQKSFYRFAAPAEEPKHEAADESDGQSLAAMASLIDSAQSRYYRSASHQKAATIKDEVSAVHQEQAGKAKSLDSSSGSENVDFHDAVEPQRLNTEHKDVQLSQKDSLPVEFVQKESEASHSAADIENEFNFGSAIDEDLKLSPTSSEDSERERSSLNENESETSTLSGRRSSESPDHSDGIFTIDETTTSQTMASPTTSDVTVFDEITPAPKKLPLAQRLFEDKLAARIHNILDTVPIEIELRTEPLPESNEDTSSVSAVSINDTDPFEHPSPEKGSRLTIVPAFTKQSKVRFSYGDNNIKLYYLQQAGRAPIKMYVRPIGDSGRVMVRVGGGWADLGVFLREYVSHHSSVLSPDGTLSVRDMGDISTSMSSRSQVEHGRATPTQSTPISRPTTPSFHNISPLDVKKTRSRNGNERGSPPSLSRNVSRVGSENEALGLAGPRARSANLSADKQAWLDGMMLKVSRDTKRSVSEKTTIGVEELESSVRRVYLTRGGDK